MRNIFINYVNYSLLFAACQGSARKPYDQKLRYFGRVKLRLLFAYDLIDKLRLF